MKIRTIPIYLQTYFMKEVESSTEPQIRRERDIFYIPVFVRQETTLATEDMPEMTVYHFFEVPVKFTGQDTSEYNKCCYQSYAALREYFYGSPAAQSEM